jgi:hypothetical protein
MGSAAKPADIHVDKPAVRQRRCPRCDSLRLYPSHCRGTGEKWLEVIGGELRRCHSCRARLCWFGFRSVRLGDNAKEGSLSSGLAVVVGCLVYVVLLWWMIARVGLN